MSAIDLFTKETDTSSFIQDVLSSVNYSVVVHDQPEAAEAKAPIVIWDLDSFETANADALARVRALSVYTNKLFNNRQHY